MKTINVKIKGKSPLLQHKYPLVPIEAIEKKTPEEQAEFAAYRIPGENRSKGNLMIPAENIQRCFVNAASFSKGKGRGSLVKESAASIFVEPNYCDLGVKDYAIDARRVVIKATKGAVVRYRPKLENWSVKFQITYDERLLSEPQLRKIVDDAGERVGLLDFRPQCKGPFGRFMVIEWESNHS